MTDEELLRLSVYSDGESTEAERREIDALLARDPAMHHALNAFSTLHAAAQNEPVPQPSLDVPGLGQGAEEGLWPLISARLAAFPDDVSARLQEFAISENVPIVSKDGGDRIWREIAVHTTALREAAPDVHAVRWHGVWKKISVRTSTAEIGTASTPVARASKRTAPATVLAPHLSAWIWAAGAGIAASILVALTFPAALVETPRVNSIEPAAAVSMSIPEAQDEHYGVRVKFVPGSSDPVVSLYFKNEHALNGSDFDSRE